MFEGPGVLLEAGVGYELSQDSSVVEICFWTNVFFLSDILLRCMYGEFCGNLVHRILYEGTVDLRFFLSWASSCIDIVLCCCCNTVILLIVTW